MNLGELEKLVLHYLWKHKDVDVKQLYSHFINVRGGSLNTYQSTLDRLFKKGLLARKKEGHAYIYNTKVERYELIGQLIKSVARDFIAGEEINIIAACSSISSEYSIDHLTNIEQLIDEQKMLN